MEMEMGMEVHLRTSQWQGKGPSSSLVYIFSFVLVQCLSKCAGSRTADTTYMGYIYYIETRLSPGREK